MAVKRSLSATRMLSVIETVARAQPIGVSAIARQLDADKSAVQRDLMTLADAGWISMTPGGAGQWELTPHILSLARPPHSSHSLRHHARPVLEQLRDKVDETVYLTVPNGNRFIVLEALESSHMLRVVPPVGMVVPVHGSATARAILPYLPEAEQARLLSEAPSATMRAEFEQTRQRGYSISDGDIAPGSTTVASAIIGAGGAPLGAVVITGPADRITPDHRAKIGALAWEAAEALSQSVRSV